MRKSESFGTTLIISGILLVVGVAFLLFILPIILYPSSDLRLGDGIFRARVALNDADRIKGLTNENGIEPDQALLMAYPSEDKWGVSMKNMNIPIDIVWLDKDKKVIFIVKNASPDETTVTVHYPKTLAKYVIELSAGSVDSKAIKVNSVAIFQINTRDIK